MAYVDDVNNMLHHEDVLFFLRRFCELATPMGGVLNTEKTRILTSTNGVKTTEALLNHPQLSFNMRGKMLQSAVATYSTKTVDGETKPVEVTDGLRVLGAQYVVGHFTEFFC